MLFIGIIVLDKTTYIRHIKIHIDMTREETPLYIIGRMSKIQSE